MATPIGQQCFARGSTIRFFATFKDANKNVVQPPGGVVNISFQAVDEQSLLEIAIPMNPPAGAETRWTADWDSRGVGDGLVSWSVHSTGGPPAAVTDGRFQLGANNANLVTFT